MNNTVKVGIADKDCRGIDNPVTKETYHVRDHVAEMPRREAEKLLRTSYGGDASILNVSHGYTRKFAEGWDRIFGGDRNAASVCR